MNSLGITQGLQGTELKNLVIAIFKSSVTSNAVISRFWWTAKRWMEESRHLFAVYFSHPSIKFPSASSKRLFAIGFSTPSCYYCCLEQKLDLFSTRSVYIIFCSLIATVALHWEMCASTTKQWGFTFFPRFAMCITSNN